MQPNSYREISSSAKAIAKDLLTLILLLLVGMGFTLMSATALAG